MAAVGRWLVEVAAAAGKEEVGPSRPGKRNRVRAHDGAFETFPYFYRQMAREVEVEGEVGGMADLACPADLCDILCAASAAEALQVLAGRYMSEGALRGYVKAKLRAWSGERGTMEELRRLVGVAKSQAAVRGIRPAVLLGEFWAAVPPGLKERFNWLALGGEAYQDFAILEKFAELAASGEDNDDRRPGARSEGRGRPGEGPQGMRYGAREGERREARCFLCLEAGHLARDCRDGVRCFSCGGLGHRAVECISSNKLASPYITPRLEFGLVQGDGDEIVVLLDREGESCALLVDTGSRFTLLRSADWEALKLPEKRLKTAGGADLRCKGPQVVAFGRAGKRFQVPVFWNQSWSILGRDFLRKYKAQIDVVGRRVEFLAADAEVTSTGGETLPEVLEEFADIMTGFGKTALVQHSIQTVPGRIVCVDNRRVPRALKPKIREHLDELLREGVIQECSGEWRSPILPIKKKDGSMRLAIDYRELNAITKKDVSPIPRIDEIIEQVGGAKVFTKLDLTKGYYQVEVRKEDREKTAFVFDDKLFCFNRMPFGLTTAPQTFQKLMNKVIEGVASARCYLDDVVIFSATAEEHVGHVRCVLARLRKAGLTLNKRKCEFAVTKMEFLGHFIEGGKLKPAGDKLARIKSWAQPSSGKELRTFVGFANYLRKFVKEFSILMAPLNRMQGSKQFVWTPECARSFEAVKNAIADVKFLYIPTASNEFVVTTDASGEGMGGSLHQVVAGERRLIEYFSKGFSDAQKRYSTIEQEATAIVFAFEIWRYFLLGAKVLVETDHKPLQWLLSKKDLPSKLGRMALKLQEFDIQGITHVKGVDNVFADALSRVQVAVLEETDSEQGWTEKMHEHRRRDPKNFRLDRTGRVFFDGRLYITSPAQVEQILKEVHDGAGHFGVYKVQEAIRKRFFWPSWQRHVRAYVKQCERCITMKSDREPTRERLQPLVSERPLERVHVDVCGPLSTSGGCRYILVMQDAFSKWLWGVPVRDTKTSTLVRAIRAGFEETGWPGGVTTDAASQFQSAEFKRFCQDRNVEVHYTSVNHHLGNGLVERAIQTLEKMLRTSGEQRDWARRVRGCVDAYNNCVHHSTGVAPAALLLGRDRAEPVDQRFELPERHVASNVWEVAAGNLRKCRQRMERAYNMACRQGEAVRVGDRVAWHTLAQAVGTSKKLNQRWRGPFQVIEREGVMALVKGRSEREVWLHVNHLKRWLGPTTTLDVLRGRGRPRLEEGGEE